MLGLKLIHVSKRTQSVTSTWWRHQMETFSALLVLCAGNSPIAGEFPSQRPVTRSFDVFSDLRLNKRGWWYGTPSCPLWRHCNEPSTLSVITVSDVLVVDPNPSPRQTWRRNAWSVSAAMTSCQLEAFGWATFCQPILLHGGSSKHRPRHTCLYYIE